MTQSIQINEIDDGANQELIINVMDSERGPQGEQGEPGAAATITAGNAYPLEEGQQPAVINTGTASNAVFDFYLPKGDKGDQGEPGAIQYKAGRGIKIIDNTIYATGGGGGGGAWGEIIGDIEDQTDLQAEFAKYTPTADLAEVATSGSYNDLSDKPVIPTPVPQVQSDWDQDDASAVDYIKNKPAIPVVPTVNDATLTIQKNGTNVATFTANSATNTTANIVTPSITMTTTDPGEGAALADGDLIGVYGGNPIIEDFSTEEINTGVKWVDGKDIYKKTVNCGALPNATTKQVPHGITDIDTIIRFHGGARTAAGTFMPFNIARPDGLTLMIGADVTTSNIQIFTGSDRSSMTGEATIYYTKQNV